MRVGEQLALPLARSREYAFSAPQLPFPIAPRLVRRAVRRVLKRIVRKPLAVKAAEIWQVQELAARSALIEQVRHTARCRARNATGRNSAAGLAAYVATPEGMRVERVIRKLESL